MKSPKAAVIIVTYNRSDVTNLALDSLAKATNKIPFSTILIDNQSSLAEYERIKRVFDYLLSQNRIQGKIVRNDENLGYAAGNNVGIRLALADPAVTHICLLNNDTVVTDGWLDGLVSRADRGLVGPVSNSVGNEQIVGVDYPPSCADGYMREAVRKFGARWSALHKGNVVPTHMLGFFCVLGPREIFDKVGLLDEAFGIGYYEDDDFCLRCRQHGYELNIVREVFVHHWGSASFGHVNEARNQKLFQKNKAVFEKKHGASPVHVKDSWSMSLRHEIDWIGEACKRGAVTSDDAFFLASNWISSVKQEVLTTANRPSFAPGGLFRVYIQSAINWRLLKKSDRIPRFFLGWVANFLELTMSTRESRHYLARKYLDYPAWKIAAPLRKFKGIFLRLIAQNNRKKTVIFFPIQSYHGRRQRPQHLADGLARQGLNVLWIEPEIANSLTWRWKPSFIVKKTKTPNLRIAYLTGFAFDNFYVSGWSKSEAKFFMNFVHTALKERGSDFESASLVIESPFWAQVLDFFPGRKTYECMDFHDGFQSATSEVQMLEDAVYEGCDQIVTTSTYLKDRLGETLGRSLPIYMIRNGCEPEHFIAASRRAESGPLTVGYFGAVAEWFDDELFVGAARLLPEVSFEIVGDATRSDLKEKIPTNVTLLGEKKYNELPELTAHWAAALIPFRLTKLILATNPVKLYEYSALGLPIVCTSIPEVKEAPIGVYFADNPADFAKAIRRAISEDSDALRAGRRDFAQANSWESRAREMKQAIESPSRGEPRAGK